LQRIRVHLFVVVVVVCFFSFLFFFLKLSPFSYGSMAKENDEKLTCEI